MDSRLKHLLVLREKSNVTARCGYTVKSATQPDDFTVWGSEVTCLSCRPK